MPRLIQRLFCSFCDARARLIWISSPVVSLSVGLLFLQCRAWGRQYETYLYWRHRVHDQSSIVNRSIATWTVFTLCFYTQIVINNRSRWRSLTIYGGWGGRWRRRWVGSGALNPRLQFVGHLFIWHTKSSDELKIFSSDSLLFRSRWCWAC